jgi:hypothetical protein
MRRCRLPGRAFEAPRHLPARGPGRRMRLLGATSRSRNAIAPGSSSSSILVPCLEPPADFSRRGGGRSQECQSGSPKWGALTERPPWRLWATSSRTGLVGGQKSPLGRYPAASPLTLDGQGAVAHAPLPSESSTRGAGRSAGRRVEAPPDGLAAKPCRRAPHPAPVIGDSGHSEEPAPQTGRHRLAPLR